jgi:Fe2+ or Zn2+ uptake regulation protein
MSTQLDETLTTAGFRPTRQRRAVFECLAGMHNHPTAEQVFAAVRHELPHISLATVYKALESLAVAGLAIRLGCGEGSARYDARMDSHYHARCRVCGQVFDVDASEPVQESLSAVRTPLARVDAIRLEFVGLCDHCRPAPFHGRFGSPIH